MSPRQDAILDFEALHYPYWAKYEMQEKVWGEFFTYIIIDFFWFILSVFTIFVPASIIAAIYCYNNNYETSWCSSFRSSSSSSSSSSSGST